MDQQELILDLYRALADNTGEMLDAAQAGDWERLSLLEGDCRTLVERLRHTEVGPVAGPHFVQRKFELIRKALAYDAEIRKVTEPWMAKLTNLIGSARQEHQLHRAYGALSSG
jgi:flagellar protein FliT